MPYNRAPFATDNVHAPFLPQQAGPPGPEGPPGKEGKVEEIKIEPVESIGANLTATSFGVGKVVGIVFFEGKCTAVIELEGQ